MSLDVPDLDERRFEEIMEDARKRLPVHSEAWTDHNAHDPGITILELLAWLAESYGYELDQVTDTHREKYLKLLDAAPREPIRATGQLTIADVAEHDGETLPAGTPIAAETTGGDIEPFETSDAVTMTAASVAAVVSEHPHGRTDHTRENAGAGRQYHAFGREAGPGCALYLGFDADPFVGDRLDLDVDYYDDDLPDEATHYDKESPFDPSIEVAWQYCTTPDRWYRDTAWSDIDVQVDGTNHLYRGGRVRLARPEDWPDDPEPVTILERDQPLYWIRGLACARADDDERYEVPPQLDAVRPNVVPVCHRESVGEVTLIPPDGDVTTAAPEGKRTTGTPNQRFAFEQAPAFAASVHVGGEPWTEVDDFDASGPSDRHYVHDPAAGEVCFGDGRRGAIPEPGQEVVAHSVAYGGGTDGNVGRDVTWQVTADRFRTLDVSPLSRIAGGRDAESVDDALARTIEERREPARAVTVDDYRTIATRTPGLRFGRAGAIVDEEGGSVRVVVLPYAPPTIERPIPTRGFLDAVETHLRRHTLLTERVEVIPPQYVPVDVTAEVTLTRGVGTAEERRRAEEDLTAFLHPLHGFEGDGWPFDRPIYESEIYEILEARTGIDGVRDVRVVAGGDTDIEENAALLPYPDDISVVVRSGPRDQCGRDV
ncbi:putative baseplate assembly protein [Halopenitus sp. H-Gu1]|uniref:putative baseplate assembly protein n=1 Tax=Halopenitus sp. H-Gu1 TaxID=3242697 RepID=UPI00359E9712